MISMNEKIEALGNKVINILEDIIEWREIELHEISLEQFKMGMGMRSILIPEPLYDDRLNGNGMIYMLYEFLMEIKSITFLKLSNDNSLPYNQRITNGNISVSVIYVQGMLDPHGFYKIDIYYK